MPARTIRAYPRAPWGTLGSDPGKGLPPGWDARDAKTGAPPGIDRGWAYAPGATAVEAVRVATNKLPDLPAEIGAAFGLTIQNQITAAWANWLAATRSRASHEPGLLGVLEPDLVAQLREVGRSPQSAELLVKPGLVLGPKALRHQDKGDALSDADWAALPIANLVVSAYRPSIKTIRQRHVAGRL